MHEFYVKNSLNNRVNAKKSFEARFTYFFEKNDLRFFSMGSLTQLTAKMANNIHKNWQILRKEHFHVRISTSDLIP